MDILITGRSAGRFLLRKIVQALVFLTGAGDQRHNKQAILFLASLLNHYNLIKSFLPSFRQLVSSYNKEEDRKL